MKLKYLVILGLVLLVAVTTAKPADADYAEYEDEPVPAPPPKPVRPSPLKGRRNPLVGRPNNNKVTSTTTTVAPEEEDIIDEDGPIDEPVEQTSTTESPKKIKPGLRPFRSNDDLLAALKRRREQASHQKSQPKAVHNENEEGLEPSSTTSKNRVQSGRKRFNLNKKSEPAAAAAAEEEPSSSSSPVRAGRRYSSRN